MTRIVKLVVGVLGGLLALCLLGSIVSGRGDRGSAAATPSVAASPQKVSSDAGSDEHSRKKERAARKYLGMDPDQFMNKMADDPDLQEKLETEWIGKYVRWQAKFVQAEGVGGLGPFFNAGTLVEMDCDSLDSDAENAKLGALKKWQPVTIEARFTRVAAMGAKLDQGRMGLVFEDCSVK